MISQERLKKVIDKVYSVKKLKPFEKEVEQKYQANIKKLSPKTKSLKPLNTSHKDIFAPMNCFVSTTAGVMNVPKLYDYKILPSQYLMTSKNVIKKLTRKIYISPKHPEFPLNLSGTSKNKNINPSGLRLKKASENDLNQNLSLEALHKTCETLLKDSRKSRKFLRKKSKLLNRKILEVKRAVSSVEKSNERVGYYLFHNKLKEGHSRLVKLDRIKPKNQRNLEVGNSDSNLLML